MNKLYERIIIFTRHPEPGKVKSRLIPSLGLERSSDLHRRLTERTLKEVRGLQEIHPLSLEVRYEGGGKKLMKQWLGPDLIYRPQKDGDLGLRMALAFRDSFQDEVHHILLIGSDCPGLDRNRMLQALEALNNNNDLILGPAFDGGYYLIGLKQEHPFLFNNISWGTDKVLRQTQNAADQTGLKTYLLDPLADIDRPDDLLLLDSILIE